MSDWDSNPHGAGVAWLADKGEISVNKGIFAKRKLQQQLNKLIGETVVAHMRFATHGALSKENCHPFWTCGDSAVMAHNGILPSPWSSSAELSDSAMMAETLSKLDLNDIMRDTPKLEFTIGYNKLVFLHKSGFIHIVNEDLGHWFGNAKGSMAWLSSAKFKKAKYGKSIVSGWDEDNYWKTPGSTVIP